jgi:hypothetical protein
MGEPREGTEADAGVDNSFAIAHTSSVLTHSYNLRSYIYSWKIGPEDIDLLPRT